MFKSVSAFSGFSVLDLKKTKKFYHKTLGLAVDESEMGLEITLPGGSHVFVYEKDNHEPATYTILNFVVDDINKAVAQLKKLGVKFDHYDGFNQDENGIARGKEANMGPDIAWFKDPSGNILSVLQN
jgi:predicted enzyme related to lactoylglutathione lyase